jgi:hypothetical protein
MRKKIANWLVSLARRIYPGSDEEMKFLMDRYAEAVIIGRSLTKVTVVDPSEYLKRDGQ